MVEHTLKNALIMGNIYDPDTDCQYVLMRVSAKDWDEYVGGDDDEA